MSLVVMKFGGTSVADPEKIRRVTERVIKTKKAGNQVVVVVSAPGDTTDNLLSFARQITNNPDPRELDLLLSTGEQVSIALVSMAIKSRGYEAISLTGPQAGIYADTSYTRAKITKIEPKKILEELRKGRIVIVAGFQGLNPYEEITTLGRGGSDLTAVALAAVLKARICQIYTDVEGVYTADPRIVPRARKLDCISYDEMLELAGSGAQVLQARAVEVAKKFDVPLEVRSTFSESRGTLVKGGEKIMKLEEALVSGVSYDKNQVKLSITDVPDRPGIAAKIFGALAKENINVDMIIQSAARDKNNDISFTVTRDDLKKCLPILKKVRNELGASEVIYDDKVAKISLIGVGMKTHPGVAAKMFRTLAEEKINIEMISTSEIKISCVIKENEIGKAVKVLHSVFELEKKSA
jgi:aspartate kinase